MLADPTGIPEGAEVTVLIGRPQDPVDVSDEELAEIDAGLAEAQSPHRVDARAFLRELRRGA
ncbi:hypothetical protein DB30_05980 [Enhygromyxa salina]|uniref:Uncharacterized protein n=1 Tax=Enhygromyxa salina TaxID=215803 RepID=A0A0C2D7D9_9BACT|nr:hypothetical protein DB30_05980 [Enhygromyxa salina]